jgi:hydrogenase expression/formation protein HypE
MSKFSLDALNRCVYPFFRSNDPDIVLGSRFGEDVAITRIEDTLLMSHVDPIIGAVNQIGWLAVHVACNDIATSGARPRWLQLLVLVPKQEDEALLTQIMGDVFKAAEETGTSIVGGHTGYSSNLSRPLVAVTALGTLREREPVLTSGAHIGDHILISKGIPLEGTAILANDFTITARELGLTEVDLSEGKALMRQVSVIPEAMIFAECGVTAMHDVTRGGLLEALLEIASLSEVGISIDPERVLIPVICGRFAHAFDFDPMKMISSGTLAATVSPDRIAAVENRLVDAGIAYADIGEVVAGKGVTMLRDGQTVEYHEIHPEDDELARMWVEHQPDNVR